eukprot:CAMPEP_0114528318 /NCGR_PEP_ID=MMETSP0109-20121206/24139_1 /TAXON_ID=29199 /ORGANISM="Chlorarachnion reptans, Strain CCCM449" /LENGTH=636 /DNA_ID=CAMNT_0001710449 /DNA_START=58 /DNA_END=1968 /DNA_ORIENTATION=-
MPRKEKKKQDDGGLTRIVIVDKDRCKPKKCRQECKRNCPVVKTGNLCIEVTPKDKIATVSEQLCVGCGICVRKCPFEALKIVNLPKNLESETTHRYGPNSFKLHRLPVPRPGQVLGLVGTNGIGKSTALKILSAKLKPNLGQFLQPPEWTDIVKNYRGSELQNFFTKLLEDDIKAVVKPQYVDHIPKRVKGTVGAVMKKRDDRGVAKEIAKELDLRHILKRGIDKLSGGELQRFAIGVVSIQKYDVYMYDEPSSYLDIRQRLNAALVIRNVVENSERYAIVVEHDLSVLDYLSDYVCCLYGKPGAYGVVTMPFSVREGINVFLAGFIPTENLRFRDDELNFKVSESVDDIDRNDGHNDYKYPSMSKTLGDFKLHIEEGGFSRAEIIVLLGQNGCGKTTFIRMLAGLVEPDDEKAELPKLHVSYKPQKISPKFKASVRQLLHKKIPKAYTHPQFVSDVMRPMKMDDIIDREVRNLSGGELQRVALTLSLGKPADIYLLDEPSAYLDSEQRIVAAKVIKRFILHAKRTAFIVEHDFIMATYLADKVVVYSGTPGIECTAHKPVGLLEGMNEFLRTLEITFRRDPTNYRPRINKKGSVKDTAQKRMGAFFYIDTEDEVDDEDIPAFLEKKKKNAAKKKK